MSRPAKIIKLEGNRDSTAGVAVFQDEVRVFVGPKAGVFATEDGMTLAGGQPGKIGIQGLGLTYAGLAQTTPFPFTLMSSMLSPPQQYPNLPIALMRDLPQMLRVLTGFLG